MPSLSGARSSRGVQGVDRPARGGGDEGGHHQGQSAAARRDCQPGIRGSHRWSGLGLEQRGTEGERATNGKLATCEDRSRRQRKIYVTDELVELYRQAQPAWMRSWDELVTGKKLMTDDERAKGRAVEAAFDKAANVMPWEHSPLSPCADGHHALLRAALLAKVVDRRRRRSAATLASG